MSTSLRIALIHDVFHEADAADRLAARLEGAKRQGAGLAVLPELPLNPWSPATKNASAADADPEGGPRTRLQQATARKVGIGLVGGVIRVHPDGRRFNTALIIDARGELVGTYAKAHLPEEPGFWETSHYGPGDAWPTPFTAFGVPFGVQICSDINRPEGCHVLGALSACAVLAPRATEAATYDRWRVVFRANALTSCLYVLSVNRPGPEFGVLIGGPSIAVDPDGQVMVESTDPVVTVEVNADRVRQARGAYPGYLPERAALYAQAWSQVASQRGR